MPKKKVTANPVAKKGSVQADLHDQPGPDKSGLDKKDPLDPYTLSVGQLQAAVRRFGEVLSDPLQHDSNRESFLQAAFIDIRHLLKIASLSLETGAKHLKLYNGIDEGGNHFFFMAPITSDGRAREDDDSLAAMCCCRIPPCPETLEDRYLG